MTQVLQSPGIHNLSPLAHDQISLQLFRLYDAYAPAIYGSVMKMGLAEHEVDRILCSTFLQIKKQIEMGPGLKEVKLITLILLAWELAEHHLETGDSPKQSPPRDKVSQFLKNKGFSTVEISRLLDSTCS